MKRIICIILVIISLFSFMLIPVSATSEDTAINAYSRQFIDLFEFGLQYKVTTYRYDGSTGSGTYVDPDIRVGSTTDKVDIQWGNTVDKISVDSVFVALRMTNQPVSVKLSSFNGTYISNSDDIYFYRFDLSGSYFANFILSIDLPEGYSGFIQIISAYAIRNVSEKVQNATLTYTGQYYNSLDQSYYTQIIDTTSMDLTNSSADSVSYGYEPGNRPTRNYFALRWDSPVPYADIFSFTFSTPNPLIPQNLLTGEEFIGVQVVDVNGSTEYVLPYTLDKVLAYSSVSGQPNYIYTLSFDTTDLNLYSRDFVVRMELQPFFPYGGDNLYTTYNLNVLDISYLNPVYKVPWYLRFYRWIDNFFTGTFSTLNNNLNNWFSSLETTIENALGLNAAAPDLTEQQQAMEESQQDMNSASQEFDDTRVEIEGVIEDIPSYEGWSDDSLIPDFDQTGLADLKLRFNAFILDVAPIFTAIWENRFILEIVVMAFLFSLGGFILFGER